MHDAKYDKIKGKINISIITLGDTKTSLSVTDRTLGENISKKNITWTLPTTLIHLIFKHLHSTTTECIFFSIVDGTFIKIDHMLIHKTGVNKLMIKVVKNMFSDQNGTHNNKISREKI